MKFSIIEKKIGKKAKIYTILFESKELDEYDDFVFNHMEKVPDAVRTLDKQLKGMACKYGFQDFNFKRESPTTHNVFRIEDTDANLRLYCIRYSNVAIVLGNGGIKLDGTQRNDENPHLQKEIDFLMLVEDLINKRILLREVKISDTSLSGNLEFEINIK